MENNKIGIGNTVSVKLTKVKKRGRPSKEDKRIYGTIHIITVPEDTPQDKLFQEFQKEADRLRLPIKFT